MKKIKTMKSLVKYLIENNKKISTMESCTGGEIASTITNIEGASNVDRKSTRLNSSHSV